MENIILTNNKDLRLVSVKVGVLSTLRFELPLVSASATHVEVIVTSGDVPSAYTATFIDATKRWRCDIAASQFPAVGKQSYEVAYVLDGKQFWDGKGWIEIENATTSGIEPQPRPEPYRYAVVSVNGYGADAQGAVRIPKTFIATDSPTTTEGFMEGDIYFNRETGATWTLCNVQSALTWVFNYKNYYTDDAVTKSSTNPVKSSGIWSAIWGALAALPTGFTSLYDWCVAQLAGKVPTSRTVNSIALTSDVTLNGADIAVSGTDATKIDAALAGKANDNAVVKLTGNQDIGGNKTFYGDVAIVNEKDLDVQGGRVAVRSSGGSDVALFEYDRLEYSTDGGMTWTSIMLDGIALKGNIPYDLVTKTISNGAVSLDDRAINAVAVSSSLASLTVNFPTATSGKARDFGLRLTVASGITTAPQIVLPQGVTCENADGEAPEIGADGAATILYFTETAANVFLVKGEVLQTITA